MAREDLKSNELVVELARLQQRAKELFAQHNKVHQDLLIVLAQINRLTGMSAKPAISPDSLERR
jgi:hypothetical protein